MVEKRLIIVLHTFNVIDRIRYSQRDMREVYLSDLFTLFPFT